MDHPAAVSLSVPDWVARRRLDVRDYHRMGDAGILGDDERVELIEGELVAMTPIGSEHSGAINAMTRLLVTSAGVKAVVAVQNPVRLDNYSEPQPDFALLRPRPDDYRRFVPLPEDVLLLIEVAQSSLRYDRTIKVPLYARHGIRELWIVDIDGAAVEVFTDPTGDRYGSVRRAGRDAALTPAALPDVTIPVALIIG